MVLILALDTSDSRGSVAVLRDDAVLGSLPHESSDDYSSWLLPAVAHVLGEARLTLADVDLFAVSAGPGSFTGLRVGLTTVKAWAEVYARPAVGVSRLEAIAEQLPSASEWLAACFDARREQVFGGLFHRTAAGLVLVGEESVIAPQEFLESVSKQAKCAVSWISLDPQVLTNLPGWPARAALGESVIAADPLLSPTIAHLAARAAAQGRSVDALALDANYVRRSDAEIFWKGNAAHGR